MVRYQHVTNDVTSGDAGTVGSGEDHGKGDSYSAPWIMATWDGGLVLLDLRRQKSHFTGKPPDFSLLATNLHFKEMLWAKKSH